MATFYFNDSPHFGGSGDGEWTNLSNWWMDDSFTIPATDLPTSADSVVAATSISTNSGSEPTLVDFTMNDPAFNSIFMGINITVTGDATFNDSSYMSSCTVTGDATFNGTSTISFSTVTGDATFNDNTYILSGTVTGDATFNDNAYMYGGTVTGDATFNDLSYAGAYSQLSGDATFNDSSYCQTFLSGTGYFFGASYIAGSQDYGAGCGSGAVFYGDSYMGEYTDIYGTVTFRQRARNLSGLGQATVILDYDKGVNGSSILGIV